MSIDFDALASSLSMTEIIRLQNLLSKELTRRFEKPLALAFSDVVGSTAYFARFGDEAGRKLQQRHFDLLNQSVPRHGGRIVDTAGDGAFLAFPNVDAATEALIEFQKLIIQDNLGLPKDHQLSVRNGIHWGPVLTDGNQVTGDAVNLCSRVTGTADGGEVRLTREAFLAFTNLKNRLACRGLGAQTLKGISRPVDVMVVEWRDWSLFPGSVVLQETGEEFTLPLTDTISFGRLREHDGVQANDIVIQLPDRTTAQKISRWHFELRRQQDGFVLCPVTDQVTEVDGTVVPKGQQAKIKPGSTVRLANAATLRFVPRAGANHDLTADHTLFPTNHG